MAVMRSVAARAVDQHPAGSGDEPGFRALGHAAARPMLERADERLAQRVLGEVEVARAAREIRQEAPVGVPRRLLGGAVRDAAQTRASSSSTGRTSTAPPTAAGLRAAHARASSRVGTSSSK